MKMFFAPAAYAAAILLSSVSVDAVLAPVAAQQDVSFDSFHDYLANYGDWVYSDRWGEVWVPGNVSDDFQPYGTNGYWAATDDYGWVWVSNYEWGDVPFHYGRWVNDPDDGWMWIPGYVWSPAWVAWRHNGDYTGWMPMPPDPEFLGRPSVGIGISLGSGVRIGIDFNDTSSYYGYSQWYPGYNEDRFARNWVFVGTAHLADRDYNRYAAPRNSYVTIVRNTTNITNYTVVNNYVVNRGVSFSDVQRASGRPVVHIALTQAIKRPQFVVQVNVGVQIQQHMRQVNPRGTGHPNSAPAPSATLVQGLSNNVPQHGGHAPMHVFSKTTVTNAPAFKGKVEAPAGGAMSAPGMSGPHEDMVKKPSDTAPAGETMHGPGGMKGPGSSGDTNAPPAEKFHKPETGGTTPTGETMHGPGGNMSGPTEHHAPPQPTTTQPSDQAPATAPPTMMHKHEDTGSGGGGMTGTSGATHDHAFDRKPPPAVAPAATPPPVQREERRPPPVAAPAATPPVQHEVHKQPPAAPPAAPPPKPDDKDKKDKKDNPQH
jgi:hypothetical protein